MKLKQDKQMMKNNKYTKTQTKTKQRISDHNTSIFILFLYLTNRIRFISENTKYIFFVLLSVK